jgi:hypothetical protein
VLIEDGSCDLGGGDDVLDLGVGVALGHRHLGRGEDDPGTLAARDAIAGGRKRAAAGLGMFALSPLPSAQLFVAAGLVAAPLLPLTAAFFAERLVSYSIYVAVASAAKRSLGSVISKSFTWPGGIALQVLMLAGLVALLRVDWTRILTDRRGFHNDEA